MPSLASSSRDLLPSIIASGASFDRSRRYRYSLYRHFDCRADLLTIIMLNPSKADAEYNDPTITRCIRFAQSNGFQQLEVVNLFAFRATMPSDLKQTRSPVGKENDQYIKNAVEKATVTLIAWGNHGQFKERDKAVLKMLEGTTLHCFGTNKQGSPKHPLYVPARQKLLVYR